MPKPALTYLTRRGNVYWFRMAVPLDLVERIGRREIKVSLRTSLACRRATAMPSPGQRNFAIDCKGACHA